MAFTLLAAKMIIFLMQVLHDFVPASQLYQVFIDSKYKNGRSTTEEECAGLLIAALFGGQHTSSLTPTWIAAYLLT